jgi:hypothetical protein
VGEDFPKVFCSFASLIMQFLSQAGHLGGRHRAAPVPCRGSSFPSDVHPSEATPQRLSADLGSAQELPHSNSALRGALNLSSHAKVRSTRMRNA